MANLFFPRGEILPPEQLLDPLVATSLGLGVLKQADIYRARDHFVGSNIPLFIEPEPGDETALDDGMNSIILNNHDFEIVQFCMSTFKSRLPKQYNEDVTASFFVGTVAGGRWHVDTSRDVRAIVNLSATPVGLAVATDWNPTDYGKARSKYDYYAFEGAANPPEPKSSKVILYNPGEAIGVINLARADRQVPHKAIACPGRVVLRLSQLVH